jgi:hypothetical protein
VPLVYVSRVAMAPSTAWRRPGPAGRRRRARGERSLRAVAQYRTAARQGGILMDLLTLVLAIVLLEVLRRLLRDLDR